MRFDRCADVDGFVGFAYDFYQIYSLHLAPHSLHLAMAVIGSSGLRFCTMTYETWFELHRLHIRTDADARPSTAAATSLFLAA
jgi:hypothetical protein